MDAEFVNPMIFKCWLPSQAQYHLHSSHQPQIQISTTQLNRAGSRFPTSPIYRKPV